MWFLWSVNPNHQKPLFQNLFNRRSTNRIDSRRINGFKTLTNFEWGMVDFFVWILKKFFFWCRTQQNYIANIYGSFILDDIALIALRLCECYISYITNKLT